MYINTVNRLATTQGHKLLLWLLETKQEGVTQSMCQVVKYGSIL